MVQKYFCTKLEASEGQVPDLPKSASKILKLPYFKMLAKLDLYSKIEFDIK